MILIYHEWEQVSVPTFTNGSKSLILDWWIWSTQSVIIILGFLTASFCPFVQNKFIFHPYTLQDSTGIVARGVVLSESLSQQRGKTEELGSKITTSSSHSTLCRNMIIGSMMFYWSKRIQSASVEAKHTCTLLIVILTACFLSVRSVTLLYSDTTSSSICEHSIRGSVSSAKSMR
jgi:hypothetical protein